MIFILHVSTMRIMIETNPILTKKVFTKFLVEVMLRNICWCRVCKICSLRMTKASFEKSEDQWKFFNQVFPKNCF